MALVISRRREDQLLIGSDIKITIISVKGGQVRLAVEAPGFEVHRLDWKDRTDLDPQIKTVLAHQEFNRKNQYQASRRKQIDSTNNPTS